MIKKILYALCSAILAVFGVSQMAVSESTQLEILKVTKVYDGDTFKVNLNCDLDFNIFMSATFIDSHIDVLFLQTPTENYLLVKTAFVLFVSNINSSPAYLTK